MKRKVIVRQVTLGALATGLLPLMAGGAGAAPAGDSAAAVCRSTFGDRGPAGGRIVGEGPPGDPMVISLGWERGDWSGDELGRIVTCVSVDGRAVPSLSTSTMAPPNTGSLTLDLTLPSGSPGSLVCEQSVLVGHGGATGRNRPTGSVCFKLRGPEPASGDGPAPIPAGRYGAARPPAPTAPDTGAAGRPGPLPPAPGSTPPARAAFEAAASPASPALGRTSTAAAPAPAPGGRAAPAAKAAPTVLPTAAAAPATALARTGLDNHIPLAGAGGLLAIGGAAILFGEPRRRPRRA